MTFEQILEAIKKDGFITTGVVAERLGVSRAYAHRLLQRLREDGLIVALGRTNRARYILASNKKAMNAAKRDLLNIRLRLRNERLSESQIFQRIEDETGIFLDVRENVYKVVRYAFTEMLNNAIDHSHSQKIEIECRRTSAAITFVVRDYGIGIFNNVCQKFRLPGTLAAIQEILKGKTTTAPKEHTGQGVFFTSKMGDVFIIDSFEKRLTVNNLIQDIFISDRTTLKGTRITFSVRLLSSRNIADVFSAFTSDEDFGFDRTRITVKLFQFGSMLPSRSEAKRVTLNLENFREVELDFMGVDTVGQAFADEIFRVWQHKHKNVRLIAIHAQPNVEVMIRRAGGEISQ